MLFRNATVSASGRWLELRLGGRNGANHTAIGVPLYSARDAVLGDGQNQFYLVEDPLAVIDVDKDAASGEVVIAIRN